MDGGGICGRRGVTTKSYLFLMRGNNSENIFPTKEDENLFYGTVHWPLGLKSRLINQMKRTTALMSQNHQ